MADPQKISEIVEASAIADSDLFVSVQNVSTTPVTRGKTGTLVKAWLKTYFDGLYQPLSAALTSLAALTLTGDGGKLGTSTGTSTADKVLVFDADGNIVASAYDAGQSGTIPLAVINGLRLSNNVTDANNDIDVAAGSCSDLTAAENMVLASAITKRLDAAWAVGTNQGGLDTGSKANSTWYYVWLIKRSDTDVVDVLFSTSVSAPTMPTDYDYKRRIGAVKTSSGGNILGFIHRGDDFWWKSPPALDVDTSTLSTSRTNYTLVSIPALGDATMVTMNVHINAASVPILHISNPDLTDVAGSDTATPLSPLGNSAGSYGFFARISQLTDSSQRISARSGVASTTFRVAVLAWEDPRGKW